MAPKYQLPGVFRSTSRSRSPQRLAKVAIKSPKGNNITTLDFPTYMTLEDLQAHIHEKDGFPPACQRLVVELRDPQRIFVRLQGQTPHFRTFVLAVEWSTTTVASVKAIIQDKEGILSDHQCLWLGAVPLQDDHKLSDYNIHNNADLWVTIKPEAELFYVARAEGAGSSSVAGVDACDL